MSSSSSVRPPRQERMVCALVVLTLLATSGCSSMMHELQPHRLQRLNRGPAPSWDPEFNSSQVDRASRRHLA